MNRLLLVALQLWATSKREMRKQENVVDAELRHAAYSAIWNGGITWFSGSENIILRHVLAPQRHSFLGATWSSSALAFEDTPRLLEFSATAIRICLLNYVAIHAKFSVFTCLFGWSVIKGQLFTWVNVPLCKKGKAWQVRIQTIGPNGENCEIRVALNKKNKSNVNYYPFD